MPDDETILFTENQEPEEPDEEKGDFKMDLYFWMQALAVALVFLVLTFTFVGRVIRVVGSSMVPTLHAGDLMLIQSIGYQPQQGDVVVLRKSTFMSEPVVKRVIATEGQHVRVSYEDHCIYVDGEKLDEPYINEVMVRPPSSELNILDVVVPEGSIYVLGDNRNQSSDSRSERLGTVDTRYVLGRAICVLMPFSDFGFIQ